MKKIVFLIAAVTCSTAFAQDQQLVGKKLEPDYTQSRFTVRGAYCSEKSTLLETVPEIIVVSISSEGDSCRVRFVHKNSYKLVGKTFHIVTPLNRSETDVSTFIVEKQ